MIPDTKNQNKHLLFYRVESLKDDYEDLEEKFEQLNHDFKEKNRHLKFLLRDFKKLFQDVQFIQFQLSSQKNILIEEKILNENVHTSKSSQFNDENILLDELIENYLGEYFSNVDDKKLIKNFDKLNFFKNKLDYLKNTVEKIQFLNGDNLKIKIIFLLNHKRQLISYLDKLKFNIRDEKRKSIDMQDDFLFEFEKKNSVSKNLKTSLTQKIGKNNVFELIISLKNRKEDLSKLKDYNLCLNQKINQFVNEDKLIEIKIDELRNQKRKLSRELRDAQNRIEELICENSHYQKKIEKLKRNKL